MPLRKKIHQAKTASPGTGLATGPAQIIEINRPNRNRYPTFSEISGLDAINPGDILVTPDVYPNMIEHLDVCEGLIIYDETQLTGRGPVVARELELPAVIDCPELVSQIQPREQLTIDAIEGQIIQYQT